MKPFLLVTGDFVKTGGMDHCNYSLAKHLADRGTETHLVAHRIDRDLAEHPNVRFHRVFKPLNSYFLGGPLISIRGRVEAARVANSGGRVVVNGGNCLWPDVNWVHHLHTKYKPAVASGPLRRLKAEVEFKAAVVSERKALTRARLLIATSASIKRELTAAYQVPEKLIHVVGLGIDAAKFRMPAPDERAAARAALALIAERGAVVFVGAVGDRRKGFDTLYAAWKMLCKDPDWDADLIVIGAGSELAAWKGNAIADGLGERIRFLGFNPAAGFVAKVLRACDVMVSPTRYEGYGLAIQEAVCMGLPAIVSAIAPVTERFEGQLAELMLRDPESVEDLVDRLHLWRSRRAKFQAETATLSCRLRQWSWEDMAARIAEIVDSNPGISL
ncbi:MAG TPA: glycosyltransferase family 4 protein [Candidatus Binataceae bacterium]|nr:glycosyltransferase family 4 protein [Candidatus Binataceae bacterium]